MPTKAQLQASLDECRAKKDALATENANLRAQLADCQASQDPDPPPPSPAGDVLRQDNFASREQTTALWGRLDAVDPSRFTFFSSGGPDNSPYVRCQVNKGDELLWDANARCEMGRNERRYGLGGNGTFFLFSEGDVLTTEFQIRIPSSYPLSRNAWQEVCQWKQANPSSVSKELGGGYPALSLLLYNNRWYLDTDSKTLWSAPCTPSQLGGWLPVRLKAFYSVDPAMGWAKLEIGEDWQSPPVVARTLYPEVPPAEFGIPAGAGIPSHLRLGPYVAPGATVAIDYANVRVVKA